MTTTTDVIDWPMRTGTEPDEQHRRRFAATLVGTGVIFAALHVPHLIADLQRGADVFVLLTGAGIPFVLAVGLTVGGYRLLHSDFHRNGIRRVGGWVLFGIVGSTLISGAALWYTLAEGGQLPHLEYLLLNFATTGAVGGLLIGWYDAQKHQRTEQLRVFQRAVDHAGHSVCLTDTDGTIEYVNPAFESQTGYDRSEALGANPRILKSGEQDEEFYAEMWETICAGEVWDEEIVNARKDGTHYHVDQTIAPVRDDSGEIAHFVAINNDITDLKQYEAQLERQNESLDQFASVVSHDLRNPLNVAMSRAELASQECETEHLEPIRRSLDRMEQLIDDVLTLARQGTTVRETEAISLSRTSEAAWQQCETAGATLDVETDQSIVGDPSRVQQLLENLFRNAVEHGSTSPDSHARQDAVEHGGDDVTVRVGELVDGFYVEDDGAGFGDEVPDDLFDAGYTTAEDGTGIGLAIVKQIVDAHGWEITATHGTDGGARFEIEGVSRSPETTSQRAASLVGRATDGSDD